MLHLFLRHLTNLRLHESKLYKTAGPASAALSPDTQSVSTIILGWKVEQEKDDFFHPEPDSCNLDFELVSKCTTVLMRYYKKCEKC